MSNREWIGYPVVGSDTSMNGKVVMTSAEVNTLWNWVLKNPVESVIMGDYTKWCSSLMFYPYKIGLMDSTYKLSVMGVSSNDITCKGIIPNLDTLGYTLGEFFYDRAQSFLDYEPYTKVQIWLPFYGFVDVKVADIEGKWVQIRLYVDYSSGSGQYVVGVNDGSVSQVNNLAYRYQMDDTDTLILGTYNVQLGYQIPITSTGMADTIRNVTLAAIKGAGTLAAGIALEKTASSVKSTSTQTKNVNVVRTSGKSITGSTHLKETSTRDTSTDLTPYIKQRRTLAGIESAGEVLNAFQLHPSSDKTNNTIINSTTCRSVVVVQRKMKPAFDLFNSSFEKYFGRPLNDKRKLSNLDGYTEIGEIHLEGDGFGQATEDEINELEQILSDGIIL